MIPPEILSDKYIMIMKTIESIREELSWEFDYGTSSRMIILQKELSQLEDLLDYYDK